METLIKVTIIN